MPAKRSKNRAGKRVWVTKAISLNLGDFQHAKIEAGLEDEPAPNENNGQTMDRLVGEIDDFLNKQGEEITSQVKAMTPNKKRKTRRR